MRAHETGLHGPHRSASTAIHIPVRRVFDSEQRPAGEAALAGRTSPRRPCRPRPRNAQQSPECPAPYTGAPLAPVNNISLCPRTIHARLGGGTVHRTGAFSPPRLVPRPNQLPRLVPGPTQLPGWCQGSKALLSLCSLRPLSPSLPPSEFFAFRPPWVSFPPSRGSRGRYPLAALGSEDFPPLSSLFSFCRPAFLAFTSSE